MGLPFVVGSSGRSPSGAAVTSHAVAKEIAACQGNIDTGIVDVLVLKHLRLDRAAETARLLVDHMRHLKEHRVKESELRGAKEYIKGSLLLSSESSENQMVRLAQNEMHFQRQVPLQEVVEKIDVVTADDIQEIADRIFSNSKTSLTILGQTKNKKDYENILSPLI